MLEKCREQALKTLDAHHIDYIFETDKIVNDTYILNISIMSNADFLPYQFRVNVHNDIDYDILMQLDELY